MRKCTLALGLMIGLGFSYPANALQCVPYARQISGVELQGDAWRWWSAAQGLYDRGNVPQIGAVLVFKQTGHMRHGHVAVVRRVVNKREIRIDHANWGTGRNTGRGQIHLDVAVLDVSPHNDWSQVRVWHEPSETFGTRVNPAYGFIYSKNRVVPSRQRHDDAVVHAAAAPMPMPPAMPHAIHDVSVSALVAPAPVVETLRAPAPAPVVETLQPPAAAPVARAARPADAAGLNAQVLARLRGNASAEPARVLQTVQPAPKPAGKVIRVSQVLAKPAADKAKAAAKPVKASKGKTAQ